MRRLLLTGFFLTVLAAMLLAGCCAHGASASGAFVRLQATRTGGSWHDILPFAAATTDSARIQRLYDAMRALKPIPDGVYSCPADAGDVYHLTFIRQDGSSLTAAAKPDGCESATIDGGPAGQIVDSAAFWQLFADTFGVPRGAITPCRC